MAIYRLIQKMFFRHTVLDLFEAINKRMAEIADEELELDVEDEVEAAFEKVAVVELMSEKGPMKVIGLNELPVAEMSKFLRLDDSLKMAHMVEMLKLCALDQEQMREYLEFISVDEANRLINQWVEKSTGVKDE